MLLELALLGILPVGTYSGSLPMTEDDEYPGTRVLQKQVHLSTRVSLLFGYSSDSVVQISNPAVPSSLYLKSM
eukprot:2559860-Rhodomonas_salina.1